MGRERVIAGDHVEIAGNEDERSCSPAAGVLTGLFLEIAVEGVIAARKRAAVMTRPKGLGAP